jgi:beta-lactamase superfamily II metal-dependent hydrolase
MSNHADLRAPVLKVAHHGSRTSTSTAFLAAVAPLTAVISVGEGNSYGLPAPETLDRLGSRPVFRTDLNGDVEMSTDGERLWVRVERDGGEGGGTRAHTRVWGMRCAVSG